MLRGFAQPIPPHAPPHASSLPYPAPPLDAPQKDRSCPLKVADVNITATNATNTFDRTWSLASKMDMASATLYAMVQVQCEQPAGGLDFCQFDSTQNSNNFATQKINSITPAMVACVIACSIIGPAFMLAYFVYDSYIKKDV
jgi:hypothetical protein